MNRPHIEFVQSQLLQWQPAPWAWPPGVQCKLLSEDLDHGGCSCILRYPAGWRQSDAGWLNTSEEFYVLDGALVINGESHSQDSYGYLPAGFTSHERSAPEGAVVLTFFDRRPEFTTGSGDYDEADLIWGLDAYALEWNPGIDPVYARIGLRSKTLRHDLTRQDRTFMVSVPAHLRPKEWSGRQERHDCVEEMFLIAGDFLSNVGLMSAGAYFWRPPGIAHGPYGSRTGNLTLIRTLGDKLENNWTDYEVRISRNPPYTPYLPDSLAGLADQEWQPPAPY